MYRHHHSRVHHTPGQVIVLYPSEGNDAWQNLNNILDWSRVGGVCVTVSEVEEELKYVLGLEELPRWSGRSYKPSCSKLTDQCVWISLSVEEKNFTSHRASQLENCCPYP